MLQLILALNHYHHRHHHPPPTHTHTHKAERYRNSILSGYGQEDNVHSSSTHSSLVVSPKEEEAASIPIAP